MDRGISTLVPGTDNAILDAWVQVGGVRVTKMPVGQEFTLHCKYSAQNLAGSVFDYTKTTLTASGGGIKRYEDSVLRGANDSNIIVKLDKFRKQTPASPTMPEGEGNLVLAFRLWLHDNADIDPPYPPEDQW